MRRFVGLLVVLFFSLPFGLSVVGCGKKTVVQYCNGQGYGPVAGQVASITLSSSLIATGESLNYGQIGSTLTASAFDCFHNSVSVKAFTYSSTNMSIADINPTSGQVCGGSWNRSSGGGVGDYTICTPPANTTTHTAFITAAANGATSNPIEVFIHPVVTGVILGTASTCTSTSGSGIPDDPASNCPVCNPSLNGVAVPTNLQPAGKSCYSQGTSTQLAARVYANGNTDPSNNITCQVGPVGLSLQGASTNIATIDSLGVITANQPGSSLVTATVSNSSSAVDAGFFTTCPPANIVLNAVGQAAGASNINVGLNTPQEFSTTVYDTNGAAITGLSLEFNSTLPINFPTSSGTVTPAFPGSATITAACVPPACNNSPFSQIGFAGTGLPVTSNGITVTAPGTASEQIYMASTNSQYIVSKNFNTGQLGSPLKLSYTPNSLVLSQDGTTIYMGSTGGLMVFATASNAVSGIFQAIQGNVLAVAPNNSYVVVTDPTRQTVSLVTPGGTVYSSFNGVGTRAEWTPDSSTLYVTLANGGVLTYTTFTGWESSTTDETYTDVAITVPNAGAYFAGKMTEGRTDCVSTGLNTSTNPPTTSPVFSPLADELTSTPTDRLAYTTDGNHLLGATVQNGAAVQDITVHLPTTTIAGVTTIAPCPVAPATIGVGFFTSSAQSHPLAGVSATAITGVIPASNSTVAAITYTGTGGILPLYAPGAGAVSDVTLSGGATSAPVAGVFSTDNTTFYAGTSGDNQVHVITITGTTGTDTSVITPNLPDANGNITAPNLIVQRPLRAQS